MLFLYASICPNPSESTAASLSRRAYSMTSYYEAILGKLFEPSNLLRFDLLDIFVKPLSVYLSADTVF